MTQRGVLGPGSAMRSPWPQRTTAVVGVLLLVSGGLQLVEATQLSLPVTETFVVPLAVPAVSLLAALARAAAFVVAAVGVSGEVGFVAGSRPGRAALVVWGLRPLALLALGAVPLAAPSPAVQVVALVLSAVVVVAALVAAIAIARTRVLVGWVRWALLPLAIVETLFALVFELPATPVGMSLVLVLAASPTEFVEPVLTLAIAVALLLWGRTEALKHRARIVHDAW